MYKVYRASRWSNPICIGEYDSLEDAEIAKAEMYIWLEDDLNAEYWIENDDEEVVG